MNSASASTVHERFPFLPATVLTVVAALLLTAVMLIDSRSWYLVPIAVTFAWLPWLMWVWPRVVTARTGIVIRNAFTTSELPYDAISYTRAGFTLQVYTKSGARVSAFGVHGRTGMGREAIRTVQAHGSGIVPVRRVEDLRPDLSRTQAEQVAQIIDRQLEHRTDTDHRGDRAIVLRRPSWPRIAVTIALIALDFALLLTPSG